MWLKSRVCVTSGGRTPSSVVNAGLVGGHHVFDVYEGILSSEALEHLQSLLDQVADVLPLLLAVVDAVSGVDWGRGNESQTDSTRTDRGGYARSGASPTVSFMSGLSKLHPGPRRHARVGKGHPSI